MSREIQAAIIGGLLGIVGTLGALFVEKLWPDGDFSIVSTQIEKKDDYELIDIKAINESSESVFITDVIFNIKKTWMPTIESVDKGRLDPSDEIIINIHPHTNKVTLDESLSFFVKPDDGERIYLKVGSREAVRFKDSFLAHIDLKFQSNIGEIAIGEFILGFNPEGIHYDKHANRQMADEILATNYPMSSKTREFLDKLKKP